MDTPQEADNIQGGSQESPESKASVNIMPISALLENRPPRAPQLEPPTDLPDRTQGQLEKARRRQELYLQKRRQRKKQRAFLQRLRATLKVFGSMALLAGLYLLATASFWDFDPAQATLHGERLISQNQLTPLLETYRGQPLYRINLSRLSAEIRANLTLADQVWVRRRLFPLCLDITLTEKPAWAVVYLHPPIQPKAPMPKNGRNEPNSPSPSAVTSPLVSSSLSPGKGEKPLPETILPAYLVHWDHSLTDLAAYTPNPATLQKITLKSVPIVAQSSQIRPALFTQVEPVGLFLNQKPQLARLLYLDVTHPHDAYAYFEGFKVRIGRLDRSAVKRLHPLFDMLPAIRAHLPQLDYVDFRWQNQIVLKTHPHP